MRKNVQLHTITKVGFHKDSLTPCLYLQVWKGKNGGITRSWAFRYASPITGKKRWLGLGSTDFVPLAEARKLAIEYRQQVRIEKRDPIEERRSTRSAAAAAAAKVMTFAQCATALMDKHLPTLKGNSSRQGWKYTLGLACAEFGKVPVAQVDTAIIIKHLTPMWARTEETASRARARIESVLDWATATGLREGDNPARWVGHLEHLLGKRAKGKHHSAMPWAEVPGFMSDLRARDGVSARALEFTVLTGARSGEVIGARWDEFDLNAKLWTVPAERMKASKEHRVPLSDRAVAILRALDRRSDFVFANDNGRPLSNMAMMQMLRGTAANGYTVHGFRSSLMDWAHERANYPKHVIDMALAHTIGDKVEAAYRRGDLLAKRVQLMNQWSRYCQSTPVAGDNVVSMRA
jgi:integrase